MKPIMKCGHVANAEHKRHDGTTEPCCVLCTGYGDSWRTVETDKTVEPNREARCAECGKKEPSSDRLAFFSFRPTKKYDDYYCGCKGWD